MSKQRKGMCALGQWSTSVECRTCVGGVPAVHVNVCGHPQDNCSLNQPLYIVPRTHGHSQRLCSTTYVQRPVMQNHAEI